MVNTICAGRTRRNIKSELLLSGERPAWILSRLLSPSSSFNFFSVSSSRPPSRALFSPTLGRGYMILFMVTFEPELFELELECLAWLALPHSVLHLAAATRLHPGYLMQGVRVPLEVAVDPVREAIVGPPSLVFALAVVHVVVLQGRELGTGLSPPERRLDQTDLFRVRTFHPETGLCPIPDRVEFQPVVLVVERLRISKKQVITVMLSALSMRKFQRSIPLLTSL
ncbi:hypothetical protein BSL78_04106 [Apostichopus japonicus]|uniref:Uncharacterized protein n=1 Tax=Stichopus japonicus TaxID=307972 RepID=A0A2G8LFH2_STIJA|nr:hypothetical protein BSL78_04106 [Apostichopus japonicus]